MNLAPGFCTLVLWQAQGDALKNSAPYPATQKIMPQKMDNWITELNIVHQMVAIISKWMNKHTHRWTNTVSMIVLVRTQTAVWPSNEAQSLQFVAIASDGRDNKITRRHTMIIAPKKRARMCCCKCQSGANISRLKPVSFPERPPTIVGVWSLPFFNVNDDLKLASRDEAKKLPVGWRIGR